MIILQIVIKIYFIILYHLRRIFYRSRFFLGFGIIKLGILLKYDFFNTYKDKIPLENIKKIIIIRTDRIGDLILTTPAITDLKKHFKNAQIDIIINSYTYAIMEKNPYMKNIILKDQYTRKELIHLLKKTKYDLAIIFSSYIEDKQIAFKSRIPFRIGSNYNGAGYLLTHHIKDTREELLHEVKACFSIIKLLKIPAKNKELVLHSNEKYKSQIIKAYKRFNLKNKEYIVIHPYSRDYKMRWPEYYYKTLVQKLVLFKKYKIVIIGSIKEKQLVSRFVNSISPSPINIAGSFSLGELIYFLKSARLFIGNSTGTMHIANALNVPVIVMYGSQYFRHHYKRWYPWNPNGHYFTAKKICKICMPWSCNLECMETITPEMVYQKACEILKI